MRDPYIYIYLVTGYIYIKGGQNHVLMRVSGVTGPGYSRLRLRSGAGFRVFVRLRIGRVRLGYVCLPGLREGV